MHKNNDAIDGLPSNSLHVSQARIAPNSAQESSVPKTLHEAFKVFFLGVYHGPRIIVAAITGLWAWRMALIPHVSPCLNEFLLAVTVVVFWCVQELVLHKQLLHSSYDWFGKRIHKGHHDRDYFHVSIDPAPLMISWMAVVSIALFLVLPNQAMAVTATIAYAAAGLFYEWTHFIVHSKVRFRKNSYFDICKTHHARHHLVDSNHWFAFSVPEVDTWFGTNPSLEALQKRQSTIGTTSD